MSIGRILGPLAVLGAIAAVTAVALGSHADTKPFDPAINTEISARALDRIAIGTPQARVERKLGRGGGVHPDGMTEPGAADECRYFTERGTDRYLAACYAVGRFVGWSRLTPKSDSYSSWD